MIFSDTPALKEDELYTNKTYFSGWFERIQEVFTGLYQTSLHSTFGKDQGFWVNVWSKQIVGFLSDYLDLSH